MSDPGSPTGLPRPTPAATRWRWSWLLALAAAFVGTLLGIALQWPAAPATGPEVELDTALATAPPSTDRPPPPSEALVDPILRRNIFDPTAIGDESEEAQDAQQTTDLPYRLVGTVVAIPEELSSAMIAPEERGAAPAGYGLGDTLAEGATLAAIARDHVVLERADGSRETLRLDGSDEPEGSDEDADDGKPSVERLGPRKWAINDAALAQVYEDPDQALEGVRAVRNRGRRTPAGVRLRQVAPGATLRLLGLQRHDVIHELNGQEVRSPADLERALGSLEQADDFDIELSRRRRPTTLSYERR